MTYPDIPEWFAIAKDVALFLAAIVGIWNTLKIREVHKLANSLASRAEERAHKEGLAIGELKGRADQMAEDKEDKTG